MSRLRTILSQKASDKSLEQLNGYFKDIYERREDPKELLAQFPTMLEHLFIQSHGKRPWLKSKSKSKLEGVKQLLSAKGIFFRVLISLSNDHKYRFEFPLSKLPHATRGLILGGKYNTLPALYLNRMDETYTKVMLNIFEFYLFYFVHFATTVRPDHTSKKNSKQTVFGDITGWTENILTKNQSAPLSRDDVVKTLYLDLLDQYTATFFPKPFTKSEIDPISKTYLQICTEFWLNQNNPSTKEFILPSYLQVDALVLLHTYVQSLLGMFDQSLIYSESFDHTVRHSRALLRLVQETFAKPLYAFLKQSFFASHWKYDTHRMLLKVTDMWLSYIAPWRKFPRAAAQSPMNEAHSQRRHTIFTTQFKRPYVIYNFLFYVPIFIKVLSMALDFDFRTISTAELDSFVNVLEVFSEPELKKMLLDIEQELLHTPQQPSYRSTFDQSTPLRSQCLGIEDNIYYQYTPLHHQSNTDIAEQLVGTLKLAQDNLRTSKTPVTVEMNENNLDARPFSLFNSPQTTKGSSVDKAEVLRSVVQIVCTIFDLNEQSIRMPTSPARGTHDATNSAPVSTLSSALFNPDTDPNDHLHLSKLGRDQIRRGLRRCTNKDVPFLGKEQPIRTDEWRSAVMAARWLNEKTGLSYDLRPLAQHGNLLLLACSVSFVLLLTWLIFF
jgi:hypothetical protein